MSDSINTIAVVGTGAVGGYYGARLAQHGSDVHFLFRSDFQHVKRHGLKVRSWVGDFSLPSDAVHAYDDPQRMPKVDLVLVTLKTTSNDAYEALIRPLLHERTAVLTIQNGLGNEARLAELFGAARVLGGMAFTCINRVAPGVIHHTDHGVIRFGEFAGGPGERTSRIAELFKRSQIPCEVLPDLKMGRWTKLVWNIPFNGLGAALDLTTDRVLAGEPGRAMAVEIMREVIAAAEAQGLRMPPDLIDRQITHTMTMGPYRSSMQVDRQEGRRLEVEAIFGEPLRQARRAGVSTPRLAMLYDLLRVIDGQQMPAPPRDDRR